MVVLWAATMEGTQLGDEFQNAHPILSVLVMGAGLGLIIGIGIKRGYKLMPLHSDKGASEESCEAKEQ